MDPIVFVFSMLSPPKNALFITGRGWIWGAGKGNYLIGPGCSGEFGGEKGDWNYELYSTTSRPPISFTFITKYSQILLQK